MCLSRPVDMLEAPLDTDLTAIRKAELDRIRVECNLAHHLANKKLQASGRRKRVHPPELQAGKDNATPSRQITATQSISTSNGPGQEWMYMKMRDGALPAK